MKKCGQNLLKQAGSAMLRSYIVLLRERRKYLEMRREGRAQDVWGRSS